MKKILILINLIAINIVSICMESNLINDNKKELDIFNALFCKTKDYVVSRYNTDYNFALFKCLKDHYKGEQTNIKSLVTFILKFYNTEKLVNFNHNIHDTIILNDFISQNPTKYTINLNEFINYIFNPANFKNLAIKYCGYNINNNNNNIIIKNNEILENLKNIIFNKKEAKIFIAYNLQNNLLSRNFFRANNISKEIFTHMN